MSRADGLHIPLAGLMRALAVVFNPYFYVFVYVALVIVRPHEYIDAFATIPVLPISLMVAFGAWLLSRDKTLAEPQYRLLILFVGAVVLSRLTQGWFGGSLDALIDFVPIVLMFVLLANTVNSIRRFDMVAWLFIAAACLMAIHGVFQVHYGAAWTGSESIHGRITYIGIFNDPNDLGMFFVLSIPLAAYLLVNARGAMARVLLGLAIGVVVYGIYLTQSRGSMLALLVVLALYAIQGYGKGVAIMMGAALLVLLPLVSGRMSEIDPGEASAHGRVDAWYEGFRMLFSDPLFGVGFGQFLDHHFRTAHNSFVLVLAETGLVGYFAWFTLIAISIAGLRRVAALPGVAESVAAERPRLAQAAFHVQISMAGMLTSAFFLSRSYNVLIYMMCALAVALVQIARRTESGWEGPTVPVRPEAWLALSAGSVVFLYLVTWLLLRMQ